MILTADIATAPGFYVVGGTLSTDAASYVEREADANLVDALRRGEFCYVLTPRQMGKSSLMVRTAARLRSENIRVAVIDLTSLGQNLTIEQWYNGSLERIGEQLDLEETIGEAWLRQEHMGPLQRWMRAISEISLSSRSGPIVIFIDEIDTVRSLSFSTDEFFAGVRELYNRRAQEPELNRLTFCLLGVATPSDLIRDTRTTPFNIGRRIELSDFTELEAAPLALGLSRNGLDGSAFLHRVLHWTGGHPYLTQLLCRAVAQDKIVRSVSAVDRVCRDLFLSPRAREHDDNLHFVRERMLRSEVDTLGLLTLYGKIRAGKKIRDDDTNPLIGVLRLSGITRPEKGNLKLRNRIYEHVFDADWILSNMPGAERRRLRAAYKRGLKVAGLIAAPLILSAALLLISLYSSTIEPPHKSFKPAAPPPFWASYSASEAVLMNSGSLLVTADKPNVDVFVADQLYGRTANDGTLRIDGLQPGTYPIRAQKPGFQSILVMGVEIKAQAESKVRVKLEEQTQVVAVGFVFIQGAPPAAQVRLDGTDVGVTSENGTFELTASPGNHQIHVSKEGFLSREIVQDFTLGARNSVDVPLQPDIEMQRWKVLMNSNDVGALRAFLHDYPTGRFSAQVRDRADMLEWSGLKTRDDAAVLIEMSDFVDRCRSAPYCDEARDRMNALKTEEEIWVAASHSDDANEYQHYLTVYPQGRYVEQARAHLAQLQQIDRTQIRDILRKYEDAYDHRNIDGILAISSNLPQAEQKRIRQEFRDNRAITLSLSPIGNIEPQGAIATVICKRAREWISTDGGGGRSQDQIVFRFVKQSGHWLIDSTAQ